MALPHKRWQIHPLLPPAAEDALAPIGPPILRQVLYNRGYTDARQARAFLAGASLESTDPLRLRGMAAAVARLGAALDRGERIVVYGDYDTDGVTATALLVQTLGALGGVVEPYIPNRFDEGYGLNTEALGTLAEGGPGLVGTVDCGTLINPRQPGDEYPYKELAGVGLAYKLAQALVSARGADFPTDSLLDLVALGTVADLAPLTGENRALVRAGLALLNRPERPGVRSLLGVSRVAPGQVSATTVGFSLGPRLNAAGRLDSALAAYELLTTRDAARLAPLAAQLEAQNRERQELTRSMHQQARELALDGQGEPLLLFAAHETFNRGVVGLAASRLVDEFYRPALVAERGPQETRGSARSIPEFHITAALDECTDLLERHGGHAAAAGFTVRN
ncbi:MAG: single-stranded-DNA-specific exonuclease RecJ, partial [Chloroflexi bacterium]|nr:single-stranded-DNA-specific exonuclease RecJ [Chloroflexota bacterium]